MKQIDMWSCLRLDSFDVEISFTKSKKAIICYLNERNISLDTHSENQLVIKSKLFSLDIIFSIAFQFNNEKLVSIVISPDMFLDGKFLYSRYKIIQNVLENKLGRPNSRSPFIMSLLDPDNRLSRWQNNGIVIEHYLLNRFGIEETINIEF